MVQFLLVRHAINEWVKTGKLAGWTPGVHLNEDGKKQAEALGQRLSKEKLTAIYSSPLERTMETAAAIAQHHPNLTVIEAEGIGEVRYGKWEGKKIKKLAKKKKWQVVQHVPSRMTFPKGESMRGTQMRAVDTIEQLYAQYKDDKAAKVVLVFHADLIKMVVAHYLGVHLDLFQRIVISPASITRLLLDEGRPFLATVNDTSHNPPLPKAEPEDDEDTPGAHDDSDADDLEDEDED